MDIAYVGDYSNIPVAFHEQTIILPSFKKFLDLLRMFMDDRGRMWSDPFLSPNFVDKQEEEHFNSS